MEVSITLAWIQSGYRGSQLSHLVKSQGTKCFLRNTGKGSPREAIGPVWSNCFSREVYLTLCNSVFWWHKKYVVGTPDGISCICTRCHFHWLVFWPQNKPWSSEQQLSEKGVVAQLCCRVLDLWPKGRWLEPHQKNCVVSLNKALYTFISTRILIKTSNYLLTVNWRQHIVLSFPRILMAISSTKDQTLSLH